MQSLQKILSNGSVFLATISLFVAIIAAPTDTQAASYAFGAVNAPYGVIATSGTVSCETAIFSGFTPYIYSGNMDSFDVTVSGAYRHLPLTIFIDGKAVDLRYANIFATNNQNTVRIHVDVPFPVKQGASIEVATLQITQGPPPLCVSTGNFIVIGTSEVTTATTPVVTAPIAAPVVPAVPSVVVAPPTTPLPPEPATPPVATTTPVGEMPLVSCEPNPTRDAGRAGLIFAGAIILLALLLYMSVTMSFGIRFSIAFGGTTLVILGLWYYLDDCHTRSWIPLVTLSIALIITIWAIIKPEGIEKHLPEWVVGK